jgi:diguanylate cyclase (GGDEF)-like protein
MGYFLIPVAMILLLARWLHPAYRRYLGALWRLCLLYPLAVLVLTLSGTVSLANTYPVFDGLFMLVLVLLLVPLLGFAGRANTEQRLILAAFALMTLLLLLDMAVAHGVITWRRIPLAWGLLGFALAVSAISLRHYGRTNARVHELYRLSYEDALTGLHNRRYFDDMLPREIALAPRAGRALSVIICDIDHFKQVNDRYGHDAGDEVLRAIGALIRRLFREDDLCCRYGGEELVIVMPGADTPVGLERAEGLRRRMAELQIEHDGRRLKPMTLSAGVASLSNGVADAQALMREADQALYRAKAGGRNRVVCAEGEHAACESASTG